ncbi:cytochrome c-type biogenesis protein CcmH [Flavobacteriaceae bacterium]|nr:cytochrome c-type biogenesis protein CcmH [Flavobacteriaceae bacterium]
MKFFRILIFLIIEFFAQNVLANIYPGKYLMPKLEQRALKLFAQINCPVCQGQTIEDSATEISSQIRGLIRKKIIEKSTDEEIKQHLIENFGPSILHSPKLDSKSWILWFLPILFGGIGAWAMRKKLSCGKIS